MKKIGILIESDFYEPEISYYEHRFAEEGMDLHFLTRLWGQSSLTFTGHESRLNTKSVNETFEGMNDTELASYDAIIVPSGMVSDRLRYTEDVTKIPPATEFLQRAFANKKIIKGIICHGLWLVAPATEMVAGRPLTCHNNLVGDAKAYGAKYTDKDLVEDGDLITARQGGVCHLLARAIINRLNAEGNAK
ncbi:MAG: protease I [Neolewinella sp.]|jgi:protease I